MYRWFSYTDASKYKHHVVAGGSGANFNYVTRLLSGLNLKSASYFIKGLHVLYVKC